MCFIVSILYGYYSKENSRFSSADVVAVLQSDLYESYHFFIEHLLTQRSISIAFVVLVVMIIAVKLNSLRSNFKNDTKALVGSLGVFFVAILLMSQLSAVIITKDTYHQYYAGIKQFHELYYTSKTSPVDDAFKKEKGELNVIIVGGSESRDFLHSYHGLAENTLWADTLRTQLDWVVFENAYSFHTQTLQSLTVAFTDGCALTGLTFPGGQNVISISKQAGIHATWLSNQVPVGSLDGSVSALVHLADNAQFTTKTSRLRFADTPPDDVLLPYIEQKLDQMNPEGNSLLIIHLKGNQSPYHGRYPENFTQVHMDATKMLGKLAGDKQQKKRYLEYLTAIKHTDEVLKSIHNVVAKHSNRSVFMLYFADHGEDVFSKGGTHAFNAFTWPMARIPMFLWFSKEYQDKYSDKVSSIRTNREKTFTNDLIYDLYLNLAGIQTKSYLEKYDISSEKYSLTLDNAVISRGKQIKTDPAMIIARNLKLEQVPILAAHRTNSLFKLKQGQALGLRKFEVDIRCEERDAEGTLQVGHDPETMAGMEFSEYLEQLAKGFDFLWMDIRNLAEENSVAVLALLNDLDITYGLRSRVLLETKQPLAVRIFAAAGWNTSYYLNWKALVDALAAGKEESLRKIAADIGNSVRQNGIGAVSYDLKADEAVRKYVLPELPSGTKLYAWNSGWAFSDPDLPNKVREYEHLSCLLIRFFSPFDI